MPAQQNIHIVSPKGVNLLQRSFEQASRLYLKLGVIGNNDAVSAAAYLFAEPLQCKDFTGFSIRSAKP